MSGKSAIRKYIDLTGCSKVVIHARQTRMKPSDSYVYRNIGSKIVRVSCTSESLVRGTRTSDSG